jgi:ATP-dependent Clp protease ATP-binding subunit ClpA
MSRGSIGFGGAKADDNTPGAEKGVIERIFSPEFRNRLDNMIRFDQLPLPIIERVVDKLAGELQAQLKEKGVELTLSPEAKTWFAQKGFDPKFGARPMARLIQNELKKPLAEMLLFGALEKKGGKVRVVVKDDKPVVELA